MLEEFVVAVCDVRCQWNQNDSPKYRCYVNDELFTERTWIWNEQYLEESIQILAPPGKYKIRYEIVDSQDAVIKPSNLRIEFGPAVITPNGSIHIYTSKQ
jgi:hypothetical protein